MQGGGIITTAVKHLIAAGVNGDALLAAIAELEQSLPQHRDEAADRRRARDREYQAERRRQKSADSADGDDAKEIPPDPHKKILNNPTPKGVCPKRGARLPDDFEVPGEWIDYAVAKRFWTRAEATEEVETFCRHFQAASGPTAIKRNWFKAWQNWVVRSYRKDGSPNAEPVDPGKWTPERMARYAKEADTPDDAATRAFRARGLSECLPGTLREAAESLRASR